uniref:Uncharacterized protein n=1 Tax=Macrostomum lignano TaxID=282301 RepID=A0A1I8GEU1_9PLAT
MRWSVGRPNMRDKTVSLRLARYSVSQQRYLHSRHRRRRLQLHPRVQRHLLRVGHRRVRGLAASLPTCQRLSQPVRHLQLPLLGWMDGKKLH